MNEGLIPSRYAKALYEVGAEKHVESRLYELMKNVVNAFMLQPGLQDVLANPFIPADDKCKLLATASGMTNDDAVFADFLTLLARNNRLDMARGVAAAYIKIYRLKNKIYEVKVTSAATMTGEEDARLRRLIQSHLNGGQMEYTCAVDPSLIGGFTVSVGNERIDASISNELKQLRLNLIRK